MNPELQRNLWLEARGRQLIGTAAVPALVFLVVWLLDRGAHPYALVVVGAGLFGFGALVWGPREARASVIHEVYARTWDSQRLSALAPWTLTWGKLVGATTRPWLLAGLGLLIAFLQLASLSSLGNALFWVIVAVSSGVLMQAGGLAVGLIELRKSRAVGKPPGLRSAGLAILALGLLGGWAAIWAHTHIYWTADVYGGALTPGGEPLIWWNHAYDPLRFAAVSLVVFAICAVGWAWRLMRLELQLRNLPWAWVAFVVLAALYVAGFNANPTFVVDGLHQRLAQAGGGFVACAYLGALIQPADPVRARQFLSALNPLAGLDLGRLAWTTPLVAQPMALACVTLIWDATVLARDEGPAAALLTLAILAFVLRDLGIVAVLRFGDRRQGDFAVLLALALLYVLGALVGRIFGGANGPALFIPTLHPAGLSLISGAVQGLFAWTWAGWRIFRTRRTPGAAQPS